jgi:hypothetical protein
VRGGGIGPLQRRCERLLTELGLSRQFTLEELLGAISKSRGRPLQVVYHAFGAGENVPCGVWASFRDGHDVVVVEERTSRAHQEHICLHELAHILCGHTGAKVLAAAYLAKLLPDLAPEKVAEVLARTGYDSVQERDAEAMATVLGRFLAPGNDCPGTPVKALRGAGDNLLGELAKAFHLDT